MKIITGEEAAALVQSESTLAVCGFGGRGAPDYLLKSLNDRFERTGSPRALFLCFGIGTGDPSARQHGLNELRHRELIGRVLCAHVKDAPLLAGWIAENAFPAYALPLGIVAELFRAQGRRLPGVLTTVGKGSFADPEQEGCRLNEKAETDSFQPVSAISLFGEDYLFYHSFPVHTCFLRASFSDPEGNISDVREPLYLEQLEIAAAVKASGGTVVVQVEKILDAGEMRNRDVILHKSLVDYVVVSDPAYHTQGYDRPDFLPELNCATGKADLRRTFQSMPLNARKVCARRAALELFPGSVVNVGIGIPDGVSSVAIEEGIDPSVVFTVESGVIGGEPVAGLGFGPSAYFEARFKMSEMLSLYQGGYLDQTFLGAAEIDEEGNVNVSSFHGSAVGPGGFVDISQNTENIYFLSSFCAVGCDLAVDDGKIRILREGLQKKFIKKVRQITFSAREAERKHQNVMYITERAVFRLVDGALLLTEIAPGLDLKRDILDQMAFRPKIDPSLRIMDTRIFSEGLMGLREEWTQREHEKK